MSVPSSSPARILDSAVQLFAARGYDATSVREICEAAGITKPTLYHFFHSKDGVFRAIVGDTLEQMHGVVRRALARQTTLTDQLGEMVREVFDDARGRPLLWRFVFGTVWCPTRAPAAEMHRRYQEMSRTLAGAIEDAARRGEIAPGLTEVRLLTLMGTVSEALSAYLILGQPALTNELAHAIVESVVHGWQPRTPSARPPASPPAGAPASTPPR